MSSDLAMIASFAIFFLVAFFGVLVYAVGMKSFVFNRGKPRPRRQR